VIKNISELAEVHGGRPARIVLSALNYALEQVDPAGLVKSSVKVKGDSIAVKGIKGEKIKLKDFDKVYVVGAGKACARMADSLCVILGKKLTLGAITVPIGEKNKVKREFRSVLEVTEGTHPVPNSSGLRGAEKIIKVLDTASSNDLVFMLISGGGSALLPLPAPGLKLSDKQRITNKLLFSGATIREVNTVRKHLSGIKGGQLLRYSNYARVVSLILSDVIDDDLSSIASGPTSPDPSTFPDALKTLRKYNLVDPKDPAIRHIINGSRGLVRDTPKRGDPVFNRVHNILIGNNELACRAAVRFLRRSHISTEYLGSRFDGEAKEYGSFLARLAVDLKAQSRSRFAVVLGGETTVTISGTAGTGGRNQEAGLSCAIQQPLQILAATMGTDGIDGSSDAAGSLVSSATCQIANRKKIDLRLHLDRHDSYPALKAANSLIFTGRTGTNVNDIAIISSVD
jgi:glycerate 2-kinase